MTRADKSLSVYHIEGAKQISRPVVFDCPHAGRIYPADFHTTCPQNLLERAEDRFMDKLLDWAPKAGIPVLVADFPRTYIDVNRGIDELDLAMLDDDWPGDTNQTDMTHAGIGLIRRMLTPTIPLADKPLTVAETKSRIDDYYVPYHAALASLIDDRWQKHGQLLHINWHSMPSRFNTGQRMPDFVLGNRFGHSAAPAFLTAGATYLREQGFNVRLNDPYPGQEIVRRSGDKGRDIHSVQVEINKALYLDETRNTLSSGHLAIRKIMAGLTDTLEHQLGLTAIPLAAD